LKGKPIEADKVYKVASWAPVAEGMSGEPIWDVVIRYLREKQVILPPTLNRPQLIGIQRNPGLA
jgi:S-sulfosulfanyl-L-cysteine sulfohydrolase